MHIDVSLIICFSDIEIVRDVSVKSFLTLQQLAEILKKLSAKCSSKLNIAKYYRNNFFIINNYLYY